MGFENLFKLSLWVCDSCLLVVLVLGIWWSGLYVLAVSLFRLILFSFIVLVCFLALV